MPGYCCDTPLKKSDTVLPSFGNVRAVLRSIRLAVVSCCLATALCSVILYVLTDGDQHVERPSWAGCSMLLRPACPPRASKVAVGSVRVWQLRRTQHSLAPSGRTRSRVLAVWIGAEPSGAAEAGTRPAEVGELLPGIAPNVTAGGRSLKVCLQSGRATADWC
jgi:hypothetical protein